MVKLRPLKNLLREIKEGCAEKLSRKFGQRWEFGRAIKLYKDYYSLANIICQFKEEGISDMEIVESFMLAGLAPEIIIRAMLGQGWDDERIIMAFGDWPQINVGDRTCEVSSDELIPMMLESGLPLPFAISFALKRGWTFDEVAEKLQLWGVEKSVILSAKIYFRDVVCSSLMAVA